MIHTYTTPIRHYECDAEQSLHPANYLRYMQESAFSASAAIGYDAAKYDQLGFQWFARYTEVEHLHPLRYGETVSIQTWVSDLRRVRSIRRYDLYSGDRLVARAFTDWVLIDVQTQRPVSVPKDLIEAYTGGKPVEAAPARKPHPIPPPPDDAAHFNRHVVWSEIDPAGHLNNAVYSAYAADALMVLRGHALSASDIQAQAIEYKSAARLGDLLDLALWQQDGRYYYVIQRGETRIAQGYLLLAGG